jgi:hypothetical protein
LREVVGLATRFTGIQAEVSVTQMLETDHSFSDAVRIHVPEIPSHV